MKRYLIVSIIALVGSWEPLPIPSDSETTKAWFERQPWTCSTDTECLKQCRALAESQGIDTDICNDETLTKGE